MAQPNANTLAHLEWLGFVQPTGLVVSAPALDKAGAVLQRSDRKGQRRLQAAVEYRRSGSGDEPSALLPDFEAFARTVLDWNFSPRGYAGGSAAPMPEDLSLHVPDYGETLRPDFAVRELEPSEEGPAWQLLVQTLEPGQDFDRVAAGAGRLEASPHSRLERLLRAKRVPAGLLFNGRALRLVSAPHGETSGWMDFKVADMLLVAGRPICTALRLLLNERRLLALPREQRLAALLTRTILRQTVARRDLAASGITRDIAHDRSRRRRSGGDKLSGRAPGPRRRPHSRPRRPRRRPRTRPRALADLRIAIELVPHRLPDSVRHAARVRRGRRRERRRPRRGPRASRPRRGIHRGPKGSEEGVLSVIDRAELPGCGHDASDHRALGRLRGH